MEKPKSYGSSYDTPLAGLTSLDLTSPAGMALLRRFDAQLRQMSTPEERRAAVQRLRCIPPLSDRASGLMVVPGGALALRQGRDVLVCDPASTLWLPDAAAVRAVVEKQPAVLHILHREAGLCLAAAGESAGCAQAASFLPDAAVLSALHPRSGSEPGPAILRWSPWGAVAWRLQPAAPSLALGISVSGESLPPDGAGVSAEIWDAPHGDERYQLLSSGLFAHLDELLGNEVSDVLRFEMVDHWTDGDDCMASLLADQMGLLPACFTTPWNRPAGMAALGSWAPAASMMQASARPMMLLGIMAEDWQGAWRPAARHGFLRLLRKSLPAGSGALLCSVREARPPLPVEQLDADRQMRCSEEDCFVLLPAPPIPEHALSLARQLADANAAPVHCVVPAWGLAQRFDALGGRGEGNAAWFGLSIRAAELAMEA